MRSYTARDNQTIYDIAIQKFGTLSNIGDVLDQITDPNSEVQFGSVLSIAETTNNIASRFEANQSFFSTWEAPFSPVGLEIFDDTFDDEFE